MSDYVCMDCGLEGHKLWRGAYTSHVELRCLPCLEKKTGKRWTPSGLLGDVSDQLGWNLPAVPADDTFWGYTSVPDEPLKWWHGLPTFKDDPVREVEWLRAWSGVWLQRSLYYGKKWLDAMNGVKA